MTPDERHLWYDFLVNLPLTVHRQKVLGPFIADFYIPSAKIVIELDGIQHQMPENVVYDEARDRYLNDHAIRVLRYPNRLIRYRFNFVCEDILKNLGLQSSSDE